MHIRKYMYEYIDLWLTFTLQVRLLYADVLGLIGRLCLAQGDYEAGEEFLNQGLKAFELYATPNHPSVGVITQVR
jgi:hypothetical protein